ncbi:unnamed protein product [Choristocarpus tenellus]
MALPSFGTGLYLDMNRDGMVDHAQVVERTGGHDWGRLYQGVALGRLFRDEGVQLEHSTPSEVSMAVRAGRLPSCYTIVVSGVPPREQLFNGSLCNEVGPLGAVQERLHNRAEYRRGRSDTEVGAATPLAVVRRRRGEGKGSTDVVFAVSTGVVTSYGADGKVNWQDRRGPTWEKDGSKGYLLLSQAKNISGRYDHGAILEDQHILVVGQDKVAVFSEGGRLMGSSALLFPPCRPPIVGDFDSDGLADLIVPGDGFITGYTLKAKGGIHALFMLVLAIVVVMLIVAASRVPEEGSGSGWTSTGRGSVKRATD